MRQHTNGFFDRFRDCKVLALSGKCDLQAPYCRLVFTFRKTMAKNPTPPKWQQSLVILTNLAIAAVVVGVLYWAQVVFIPLGMALFLTFLLTPIVRALQRRGLGRTLSVMVVVLGTALLLTGTIWIVGQQLSGLVAELPNYTTNIREKIKSIRALGSGSERLERMIEDVGAELKSPSPKASNELSKAGSHDKARDSVDTPRTVVLEPKSPVWLSSLPAYLSSLFESIGSLALALILLIFMLLNREDLRNRFLRLVGHGRMSSTTKAVDDAGQRISRYLLMQAIVNGTFGLILAAGLLLIGVPYALLWGFLAAVLRYIPYVGAWIAAAFPIILSLARFDHWWPILAVVGFVLMLELTTANVMEPLLYGQSMGISAVAQLVAAAFWAFLWGPIGLVLSAPLTVVLLVLGKHVPQLEFLEVLLGDEPALEPNVILYQRLLAHDQDEATQLVLEMSKSATSQHLYDELLIPVLNDANRDRRNDELSDEDEQFVFQIDARYFKGPRWTTAGQHDTGRQKDAAVEIEAKRDQVRIRLLVSPARDEADRLGLLMLRDLLDPAKWDVEITAVEKLTSELVAQVEQEKYSVVCIGSLPPGGLAQSRYLCKRLRAQFPRLKIIVGRWGLPGNADGNREQLEEAGADLMGTTLRETCTQLDSCLSILIHKESLAVAG